jgi:hypothetical protein
MVRVELHAQFEVKPLHDTVGPVLTYGGYSELNKSVYLPVPDDFCCYRQALFTEYGVMFIP